MAPGLQAALQLVLGVALIVLAALVPMAKESFGTLIGLGSALIGNVPKGPLEGRGSQPPPRG
jgi:hypothetical protein